MPAARCPHCGRATRVVHVHGHGQCSHCNTNVDPCCSGADAANEIHEAQHRSADLPADWFLRVFANLGGSDAAVTAEALRQAVANALGITLAEADQILTDGLRRNRLVTSGSGICVAQASGPPLRR